MNVWYFSGDFKICSKRLSLSSSDSGRNEYSNTLCSFEDTDLGDVLGFYVTSTSETINQLFYKSNATGVLYNTTMANNAVMFSLSTEEATLSNQKEVMSLFDK